MGAELYPTVQAWLIRAQHDLANAEFTAQHRTDLLDTVVYHCQQAAEKTMKAFLASDNQPILKTHDVGKLVQLVAANQPGFAPLQPFADPLTPFATEYRYPADDEAPMPSVQKATEALAAARRIYDFVLSLLPQETHPL
jgi:HEPN domain-containing protein